MSVCAGRVSVMNRVVSRKGKAEGISLSIWCGQEKNISPFAWSHRPLTNCWVRSKREASSLARLASTGGGTGSLWFVHVRVS